jgi:hypothetical protein
MLFDGSVYNHNHDVLTGVTQGVSATANPVDFSTISASSPYLSGTNPTIHEVQSKHDGPAGQDARVPAERHGRLHRARPPVVHPGARHAIRRRLPEAGDRVRVVPVAGGDRPVEHGDRVRANGIRRLRCVPDRPGFFTGYTGGLRVQR